MRLMFFAPHRSASSPIFVSFSILKIFDLVKVLNILFVHQYLNSALPDYTLNTFNFRTSEHIYGTRGRILNLLAQPNVNTISFGLYSLSKCAISQWNSFQNLNTHTELSTLFYSKLKSMITDHLAKLLRCH